VVWPVWRVMEVMTARPQVRVNQLGYLLGRPKQATLISNAIEPVGFAVRDRDGGIAHTGLSQVWPVRPEPTSGLNVHVVDFSVLNIPGVGFRIEAGAQISHPFEIRTRLYERLTADALRFFYAMRSGTPILDSIAPGYGRPAGHLGRHQIAETSQCPRGQGRKRSSSIRGGSARAHLTSRAAGMTRAITAST
jgi:endoglucanase